MNLVKRPASTPKLLQVYSDILREKEARVFIERIDATKDHSSTHYLPHHHVEKDSSTTPIRIVFDCSCRQVSNHPCLNDCLMIGFPCSYNLCAILVHFRLHQFGISTDIKKPFCTFVFILRIETLPDFSGSWTQQTPPASFVCTDSRSYPLAQPVRHLC